MSGYEIVNVLGALPMNGTTSCVATCRSDKRVLGGGYSSSVTAGSGKRMARRFQEQWWKWGPPLCTPFVSLLIKTT
jgi:hypothetical protein